MWCVAHICLNYFLVKSGLYSIWLGFPEHVRPEKIVRRAQEMVMEKKEEVRMQVRRRKRRQFEARRQYLEDRDSPPTAGHKQGGQGGQGGQSSNGMAAGTLNGTTNGGASALSIAAQRQF